MLGRADFSVVGGQVAGAGAWGRWAGWSGEGGAVAAGVAQMTAAPPEVMASLWPMARPARDGGAAHDRYGRRVATSNLVQQPGPCSPLPPLPSRPKPTNMGAPRAAALAQLTCENEVLRSAAPSKGNRQSPNAHSAVKHLRSRMTTCLNDMEVIRYAVCQHFLAIWR